MELNELESLINDLIEGVIAEEEFARLQQELTENPEARKIYCQYIHVQNALDEHSSGASAFASSKVVPIEKILRRQRSRQFKIAILAAAAVLIISLVTMRLFFVDAARPASLAFQTSPGTQFTLEHRGDDDSPEGMVLEKGSRLRLRQGTVELSFASGVKSVVMAPADLTLHGDDTLFLRKGTAWFHVPKGAEGFTVRTDDLNVVDLGTEFGVFAKPGDHDEVHVFKGAVQVSAKRLRKDSVTLTVGEARRIDPVGRLTEIPIRSTAFMTKLPKTLPRLHWSFDSEDGFQVGGEHPVVADLITSPEGEVESCAGVRGSALRLGGKGVLNTNWSGFSGDRPRTVAFWIKLPKEGQAHDFAGIVGWGDNSAVDSKWVVTVYQKLPSQNGRISLNWGQSSIKTDYIVSTETWHHVIVSDTGKVAADGVPQAWVYIDGVNVKTSIGGEIRDVVDTVTYTNNAIPLTIGSTIRDPKVAHRRRYLHADLDELSIFEGAMSSEQARRFHAEQLSHTEEN